MYQQLRRPILFLFVLIFLATSMPPVAQAQTYVFEVYNDPNYAGGWCYSNSPMTANIAASCNDQISSVQLSPGWSTRVYRDQNETGPNVCLNRSDPNFSDNTFEDGSSLDNAISSFILYSQSYCAGAPVPAYPLEVYNDPGYNGSWCYSPNAESANIYISCNDLVSAILLRSGWSLRVYRDPGQTGPSACITTSDSDLTDNTFDGGGSLNDAISSFGLYNQPGCPATDPLPTPTYPLEVYSNSHYTGTRCYSLSPETANIYTTCNDQVSSLLLQPGWSVRFYRDPNNGGPSACLNVSDNDLADNTFDDGSPLNDAISSFTLANQAGCPSVLPPATYPLQVFTGANYTGARCFSIVAETANIYTTCNDQVSSLLLQPGWSVRFYRDANQGGPSACLTASDPDLGDNAFDGGGALSDAISSFTLYQQAACPTNAPPAAHALEVYNDPGYSGWLCYSSAPATANIYVSCADHISSLRLLSGWSVRVFRDSTQSGPDACFTASDSDLRNNTFSNGAGLNDAISSFVLYHQASCPPLNTNPEPPTEPTPIPTPGAPLTVTFFEVNPSAPWRSCYDIRVTLHNHTSSDITQQVSLQEQASYFTANDAPANRPSSQADRVRDCKTGKVYNFNGSFLYQQEVTVPANGEQSFYFSLAHDWDWIERTTFREQIRDELLGEILDLAASRAGLKLIDLLKNAGQNAQFVQEVTNMLGAIPVARYTYTFTTSGVTAEDGTIRTEVPAIMQGYLRGSIVDTTLYFLCGYGKPKWTKIILLPCAATYFTSVWAYLNAQGPPPWQIMQSAQVSADTSYTELVEPQPIVLAFIDTLIDPSQRAFAKGYLDAISQQRAALASYQHAAAAANAGDTYWYTIQLAHARQFHDREQTITRSMIDIGDGFLADLPPLNTAQIDALKTELATSGFDAETSSIFGELGISVSDQQALSQRLSQINTQDWPLPPDVSVVALRHSEAVEDIANAMRPSSQSVYLPLTLR
jgi:hypothetical protein